MKVEREQSSLVASVQLLGLDADTNYNVEVFAEQLSTHLLSKSVDLSFTTKRPSMSRMSQRTIDSFISLVVPKLIRDINIRRISLNTVLISWSSNDFDLYQIRYWSLADENSKLLLTLLQNNFTLLTTSEHYKFQLRGHTRFGWSSYTHEKLVSLRSMLVDDQLLHGTTADRLTGVTTKFVENRNILLIGPLIILILLITVIILAFIYSKK